MIILPITFGVFKDSLSKTRGQYYHIGAGDGIRTRDLQLGKLTLYR